MRKYDTIKCSRVFIVKLPMRFDVIFQSPYKLLYFCHSSPYKLLYYAWVTCGISCNGFDRLVSFPEGVGIEAKYR